MFARTGLLAGGLQQAVRPAPIEPEREGHQPIPA